MRAWESIALESVAAEITVGHVGSMASEYVATGIPFLRSLNVEPFRLKYDDLKFITKEFHNRLRKSALAPGDVVIVRTGKPGAAAVVPESLPVSNCSDLVIVRCGSSLDPRFLAYYMNSAATHHVSAHLVGAVQQHFNVGSARRLTLLLPPLREQQAIVALLGALDDKIELNRRTNETLEAMARALFKDWFVDFGPVRAKMEGRQPAGIDEATASVFPATFHESELGPIPEGWDVACLHEIASVTMGLSPKGESYNSVGIGVPLINGPVEFGDYFPVKSKWTEAATRFAVEGDIVFCVRGSTTGRRVVADGRYGIGRGVCAIQSKGDFHSFLYQTINVGLDRLLEKTTGSVFPSLSAPDIKGFSILRPSSNTMEAYESVTKPLVQRIQRNHCQSATLSLLRETLLPRLLSGEIRVREAEKAVERVA